MDREQQFRVFCAYPQDCGAETVVDSEQLAKDLVEFHEDAEPKHRADYEAL